MVFVISMVESFINARDDNPETVSNRLNVNVKQSKPILEYYNEKGVLKTLMVRKILTM